jgi:hypothetical protein
MTPPSAFVTHPPDIGAICGRASVGPGSRWARVGRHGQRAWPTGDPPGIAVAEQYGAAPITNRVRGSSASPALARGLRDDTAPGHRVDTGWFEVAFYILSGGKDLVACRSSLPTLERDPAWGGSPRIGRLGHPGPDRDRTVCSPLKGAASRRYRWAGRPLIPCRRATKHQDRCQRSISYRRALRAVPS